MAIWYIHQRVILRSRREYHTNPDANMQLCIPVDPFQMVDLLVFFAIRILIAETHSGTSFMLSWSRSLRPSIFASVPTVIMCPFWKNFSAKVSMMGKSFWIVGCNNLVFAFLESMDGVLSLAWGCSGFPRTSSSPAITTSSATGSNSPRVL